MTADDPPGRAGDHDQKGITLVLNERDLEKAASRLEGSVGGTVRLA